MTEQPRTRRPRPQPALSPEDRAALLKVVDPTTGETLFDRRRCEHCGGVHDRACYRIKRKVERTTSDGREVEVEYFERWDTRHTIWPEMLGVIDNREVDG